MWWISLLIILTVGLCVGIALFYWKRVQHEAAEVRKLVPPDDSLFKEVRRIEMETKRLSNHIFSGEYHTAFKGRGMSFSEVRGYNYGDDVRNIDWNVTARTSSPHVKVFEEERELTVMLLIDVSSSMQFGTGPASMEKRLIAAKIAAILAFSASANNDKVGAIFFSNQIEGFIPAKKGRQHILHIIREMRHLQPVGIGTDLSVALSYFNNLIKKRCIGFLLSDFQGVNNNYEAALRIASRRHDITAMQLLDAAEAELPEVGMLEVVDAETNSIRFLDTNDANLRQQVRQQQKALSTQLSTSFRKAGADIVTLHTHGDYTNDLMRFFKSR